MRSLRKEPPAPTVIAQAVIENDRVDLVARQVWIINCDDDHVSPQDHAAVVVDEFGAKRVPILCKLEVVPLGIVAHVMLQREKIAENVVSRMDQTPALGEIGLFVKPEDRVVL